jgi:hypothetical protein
MTLDADRFKSPEVDALAKRLVAVVFKGMDEGAVAIILSSFSRRRDLEKATCIEGQVAPRGEANMIGSQIPERQKEILFRAVETLDIKFFKSCVASIKYFESAPNFTEKERIFYCYLFFWLEQNLIPTNRELRESLKESFKVDIDARNLAGRCKLYELSLAPGRRGRPKK